MNKRTEKIDKEGLVFIAEVEDGWNYYWSIENKRLFLNHGENYYLEDINTIERMKDDKNERVRIAYNKCKAFIENLPSSFHTVGMTVERYKQYQDWLYEKEYNDRMKKYQGDLIEVKKSICVHTDINSDYLLLENISLDKLCKFLLELQYKIENKK